MRDFLNLAIEYMKEQNVTYGDIRFGSYQWQNISTRNTMVTNVSDVQSEGFGIRVFANGGWGFASNTDFTPENIRTTVKRAVEIAFASALTQTNGFHFASEKPEHIVWITPYDVDPFSVPISEKVDLLLAINSKLMKRSAIKFAVSGMNFAKEHKYFMNTEGTFTDQLLIRVDASYTATAIGPEGFESRTYTLIPLNIGYEHVHKAPLLDETERIAEEAIALLRAKECSCEETDLILLPSHTCLTIHETIGHATELDRVMGWEADMAGTSFATIDKLNNLKYGSDIFNVIADRTQKHGRSSVPVDDEGVKTGKWHIIKDGILTGYATTRCTSHFIGESQSRGCSYADSWQSVPILRMPNVSIEPGPVDSPSLEELIADTKRGVLVDGMGSFSIDHQRINFQFGGDCVWRIENGKIGEVIRRFTYQSHNPAFWNSVDVICRKDEWQQYGVVNCGKGQPMQRAQLTHGSAPLRLRNISIGRAKI
ncbi:TldD/PmbA family protein [bacterium]|nr:TldD/PmbA family protein [candidate division CSSED10-310 bacterium]